MQKLKVWDITVIRNVKGEERGAAALVQFQIIS